MDYFKRACELQEQSIIDRRYLHEHAELGDNLPLTTAYVRQRLSEMGYTPLDICKSGIVATVGKPGKVFLLRADMDALPMSEESGLPYACTHSPHAHTCGHDLHTAALLCTAKLLKEQEAELNGTVKLMFQPAEETLQGAKMMVDSGVLENPKVDAAFAAHVTPRYEVGQIALISGVAMAACYGFRIHIKGFSAHGCYPEQAISPINIAAHIYLGLQELIARESDPTKTAVLTIGSIHSGSMPNTIPNEAIMEGTLRTFDQDLIDFLIDRANCIVEKTAEAYRGKAYIEVLWNVPVVYNARSLHDDVCRYYEATFQKKPLVDALIAGSEDFAFISQKVPAVDLYIGATKKENLGTYYPAHHPKCVFDEDVLPYSASLNATIATNWLKENG